LYNWLRRTPRGSTTSPTSRSRPALRPSAERITRSGSDSKYAREGIPAAYGNTLAKGNRAHTSGSRVVFRPLDSIHPGATAFTRTAAAADQAIGRYAQWVRPKLGL
jgi:hypothetical protein